MTIYCNERSKATVTVLGENGKKVFESLHPPVDVQWHEPSTVNKTYPATSSWSEEFSSEIFDVVLTSTEDIYFAVGLFDDDLPTTCPTLSSPNTNRFGSGDTININKKHLYWDGDSNYGDNRGSCSYQIYLLGFLSIIDKNGQEMRGYYRYKPEWFVVCGDDCPKGSHKCKHGRYPGYCCVPCKETGAKLKNIANKIGR